MPARTSELQALHEQALAFYRTKAARDGENFETAASIRAPQSAVVPQSLLDSEPGHQQSVANDFFRVAMPSYFLGVDDRSDASFEVGAPGQG